MADPAASITPHRFLPMMGYSDGTLSVLDWRTSQTIFSTEAHIPGPVTAIGSTWNSIVTSGQCLLSLEDSLGAPAPSQSPNPGSCFPKVAI